MLTERHLADLRSSGLSDQTILSAGFRSANTVEVESILGFTVGAGLIIPYPGTANGAGPFIRVKPDEPFADSDGRLAKYLTKKNGGNRLYVPPSYKADDVSKNTGIPLIITEGEKKALKGQQELTGFFTVGLPGVWCFKAKGQDLIDDLRKIDYKDREVFITYDSDVVQKAEVQRAENELAELLTERGARVYIVRIPAAADGSKQGLDDYLLAQSAETFVEDVIHNAKEWSKPGRLRAVTMEELLAWQAPPREHVLDPIIQTQGLAMMYAMRGVGKTNMSLGIACAIAAGGSFLKWKAPKPRKVLYVDGEMPAVTMQDRCAAIVAGMDVDLDPANFRLITQDLQDCGIPSLSSALGQGLIEDHFKDTEFLILDNISTLCRGGKENESESWLPVQEWVLSLRRRGISVLLDHHAGKNGSQRGTSRKEDVLDLVIALKHPTDYQPDQGLRCEVHFEKSRGIYGPDVEPFEVQMQSDRGAAVWLMRNISDVLEARARIMFTDGMTVRDVAEELKISKSTAGRLKRKVEGGL